MSAEHVRFDCPSCALRIEADESPDRAEADEPRYLRVGWCGNERRQVVLDVENTAFRGHCPDCGEAVALLHFPILSCPRCSAPAHPKHAYVGPL